ncbi:MAG: branched-chain amino acid ABC transporter permease [Solirubrobacteraceae bacterium]
MSTTAPTPATAVPAAAGAAARLRVSLTTGRGPLLAGRLGLVVLAAAIVLIVGVNGTSTLRYSLVIGVIYAITILGNNAILATLGEINLASGAFMAVGAYTMAYTLSKGWALPTALLAVIVVSAVIGLLIAVPTVRLTGLFTALATFALAYAIPDLSLELSAVTGGDAGISVLPQTVGGELLDGSSSLMLTIVLVLFVLLAAASMVLFGRGPGARLLAVGEAPHAAASFGLRSTGLKLAVWTWAAVLGGIAGGAYALTVGFLNPTIFVVFLSISLLAGSLVGGARSAIGALLGGLLVGALPSNIQSVVPASATGAVFGAVLLIALLAGSGGLGALLERTILRPFVRSRTA